MTTDEKVGWYLSSFETFEKTLNGGNHLHAIRKAAINRFGKLGFPTSRHEEWRFTSISPIAREKFQVAPRSVAGFPTPLEIDRVSLPGLSVPRLVFVDGNFSEKLSSPPPGVTAGNLADAPADQISENLARIAPYDTEAFTALNTGFLRDGAFISVAAGKIVDTLVLMYLSTGEDERPLASYPRNLMVLGRDARATVIEHYASLKPGRYLTNAVTEISLAEGASADLMKIQRESARAYHVGSTYVRLGPRSTFRSNSISLGGQLVRNNIAAVLDGEGCDCTLNGLSLGTGSQLVDNHTTIDHAKPNSTSHEVYKAILDGRSKGVFNGKIFVRKDAQKTDAKQTNKTLLLSEEATMNTKPQLEIFADDVKCTHGATVGYLDAEHLFYLRSRGISRDDARDILTFAFAADVTGRIPLPPVRDFLEKILHEHLEQGRSAEMQP